MSIKPVTKYSIKYDPVNILLIFMFVIIGISILGYHIGTIIEAKHIYKSYCNTHKMEFISLDGREYCKDKLKLHRIGFAWNVK